MKKIVSFILMLIGITGCGCKEDTVRVKIDYEEMPTVNDSSIYLNRAFGLLSYELKSTEEFDEKVNNKDSFVIFIYSETCSGCRLLAPALQEYVDENNIVIYTLNYAHVSDKHALYTFGVNTTPFLVLVEKGNLVYLELADKLVFNDKEANAKWAKEWMDKHVEWGNK